MVVPGLERSLYQTEAEFCKIGSCRPSGSHCGGPDFAGIVAALVVALALSADLVVPLCLPAPAEEAAIAEAVELASGLVENLVWCL